MTLVMNAHPANRPGTPRRIFIAGWGLHQAFLPLVAAGVFDLSAGSSPWLWLVVLGVGGKILGTLLQRRAWTLSSAAGGGNPPMGDAPSTLMLASEILAQVVIAVLVFALALWSSLFGMLVGILFAAALLGHFAADAATRFLRVSGTLQQFMIARIVVAAVLVVVSLTPALLAAQTGAAVASAALAVGTVVGITGMLTILSRVGRSKWGS
ncbi:MAG: hypothetical protein JST25_15540 [Actinobacteria bacterium]|nr:hypothetical protein [Actinomycetota bacterium]